MGPDFDEVAYLLKCQETDDYSGYYDKVMEYEEQLRENDRKKEEENEE